MKNKFDRPFDPRVTIIAKAINDREPDYIAAEFIVSQLKWGGYRIAKISKRKK